MRSVLTCTPDQGIRHTPVRGNEVGHISNVHPHSPPTRLAFHGLHVHSIIQVFGSGGVNGKHAGSSVWQRMRGEEVR